MKLSRGKKVHGGVTEVVQSIVFSVVEGQTLIGDSI